MSKQCLAIRAAILLPLAVFCVQAQSTAPNNITFAASGYRLPPTAADASPGQLIVVSVYGIKTPIPSPELAVYTGTGPTEIEGISVDLLGAGNSPTVTPVILRGIQQSQCGTTPGCMPLTSITIQLPLNLSSVPNSAPEFLQLRISEKGVPTGFFYIHPVTDRVHVINTCDNDLISLSVGPSQEVCTAMVLDGQNLVTSAQPAHPGDELAMYLYGLGAIDSSGSAFPFPAKLTQSFLLNYDFRPNASASRPVAGFGISGLPVASTYDGAGLYQMNFIVPPLPANLPPCDGVQIKSNLTVTIKGPHSSGTAKICVTP